VVLGSSFNINKAKDQYVANICNNVALAMGIFTTVINVIISGFDMRETDKWSLFNATSRSPPNNQ
jgi:hypothetical protein